jgi:hypothetical protein
LGILWKDCFWLGVWVLHQVSFLILVYFLKSWINWDFFSIISPLVDFYNPSCKLEIRILIFGYVLYSFFFKKKKKALSTTLVPAVSTPGCFPFPFPFCFSFSVEQWDIFTSWKLEWAVPAKTRLLIPFRG